jgi:hypothetical protein
MLVSRSKLRVIRVRAFVADEGNLVVDEAVEDTRCAMARGARAVIEYKIAATADPALRYPKPDVKGRGA